MVFQLDFKGPYHNSRMRVGNVFVVSDLYGYFCILATFQSKKVRRF